MTSLKVRSGILDIARYVPGRDTADGGTRLIKLSSNETPLGTSPRAIAAYKALGDSLHRYPDGSSYDLIEALAAKHGLDAERIVCGNGSDELLELLPHAFAGPGDEVLFSAHGFAIYPIAARAAGATPVAAPETNLTASVDAMLDLAGPNTTLCYLANPNNPTGTYISTNELRRLREGLPERALLVIDAAYAEYLHSDDYSPGIDLVDAYDNVVMTRTFSKIYGLAALRLGWLYGSPSVVDVLHRIRAPFNVNAASQVAGLAALEDDAFIADAVAHNDRWVPWLEKEISALGFTIHPSRANFILMEFPDAPGRDAAAANAYLMSHGIIPRQLGNYGLPLCLRLSLGLEDENRFVVEKLAAFMQQQ